MVLIIKCAHLASSSPAGDADRDLEPSSFSFLLSFSGLRERDLLSPPDLDLDLDLLAEPDRDLDLDLDRDLDLDPLLSLGLDRDLDFESFLLLLDLDLDLESFLLLLDLDLVSFSTRNEKDYFKFSYIFLSW